MPEKTARPNRRGVFAMAASAAASVALPSGAHARTSSAKARHLDLADAADSLTAVVKLRGDLSGKQVLQWYNGTISAIVMDRVPVPLFRFQGVIRTVWTAQIDGSYTYRTFDLGFFGDLETGRYAPTLKNPVTGEMVEPMPLRDGPIASHYTVNGILTQGAQRDMTARLSLPWVSSGDEVWYATSSGFEFPNPLPPAQWPKASSGEKVHQRTTITYRGRRSELENPATTSAPLTTLLVAVASWTPWLQMGQTPGFALIQTVGRKIGRLEEASPEAQDFIAKTMPNYLTVETPWASEGNSWASYKRGHTPERG